MNTHILRATWLRAAAVLVPLVALGAVTATPASASMIWAASNVQLVNWQTGKCLTIAGGVSIDNNVPAVQYTCDGHPSRFWEIRDWYG